MPAVGDEWGTRNDGMRVSDAERSGGLAVRLKGTGGLLQKCRLDGMEIWVGQICASSKIPFLS